ncbi:MAG: hypothetical protein RL009_60 [Actinomycetota bacterium]
MASQKRSHRSFTEQIVRLVEPFDAFLKRNPAIEQQHDGASEAVQRFAIDDGFGRNYLVGTAPE